VKFPFILRSHHEEVIHLLRSQIEGLARTLYNGDVPEEFQLLLGMKIPKSARPSTPPESPQEPSLTREQQFEEEETTRQRDLRAELAARVRTRPSTVGPRMEQVMKQTTMYAARAANPGVAQMFDAARQDALKNK
jgi:hypothetical protein